MPFDSTDVVSLLKRLVPLQPVTANVDNVNAAVDLVGGYLRDAGVHTREYRLGDRRILYAATENTLCVDYLLNAHLDVVPAAEERFRIREKDGWLTGRGTADCLGNAALIAVLLARLRNNASVGAIFSTDEETGGETTATMASQGLRARRLVCVLDGRGYAITIAQKGVLTVALRASGTSCHSAEPWHGVNALDRLIDGYCAVRTFFPHASAEDPWHNTMAATVCHAGTAANRVPDSAEMTLNIRFVRPEDKQAILQTLREKSGLEVLPKMSCSPVAIDPDHPEIRRLQGHLQTRLGCEIPFDRLNGATDARHFADRETPLVILGLPGTGLHADDEALERAAIEPYFQALAAYFSTPRQTTSG